MPIYEIHHSYPLRANEKQELAESITKLHATTFITPSAFVHVRFISHDATDQSYFVAGKPHVECTNRIIAYVRHSSARSKANYDALAEKIEEAWKQAIYGDVIQDGKDQGKRAKEVGESDRERLARKLLAVAFTPMLAVRELGVAMPEAGGEAAWFKENAEYFREQSEIKGDVTFKEMLEEVKTREDLKKTIGGGG